jgi:hypothetical protein
MEKKPCYWGEAPPPKKRGVSEKAKASSSKKKIEDSEVSESEESDRTVGKGRGSESGSGHLAALVSEMRKMRGLEEERNETLADLNAGVWKMVSTMKETGRRVEGVLHDLRFEVQDLIAELQADLDMGFLPEELENGDSETESESEVPGDAELEALRKEKEEAREKADAEEEAAAALAAEAESEQVGGGEVAEVGEGAEGPVV